MVVFYRVYSESLESYIMGDSLLSFAKDGSYPYLNHKVPRMSIFVTLSGDAAADKKRLKSLKDELSKQAVDGKILAWQ